MDPKGVFTNLSTRKWGKSRNEFTAEESLWRGWWMTCDVVQDGKGPGVGTEP